MGQKTSFLVFTDLSTNQFVHYSLDALAPSAWNRRGDYSFEVFNDDYQQLPLPVVAERARRAAVWLAEDVLRRSVPLPHTMHRAAPSR